MKRFNMFTSLTLASILPKPKNDSGQAGMTACAVLFVIVCLSALLYLAGNASAELTVEANHSHINIDFFYHGSTVGVRGTSDPGTDVVIKITSPEGHHALRKKGKVAGFLWMNTGELKLEHSPDFYFIHSTKNLDDILSQEERDKYVIGYQSLDRHLEISPVNNDDEKNKWFNEFVKYKESSKVYGSSTGKILLNEKDGKQNYYILTEWPYQAAPGTYTVTAYAVKDNKVLEKAETNVQVEQVSVIKTLAGMAKNNGALYGIISILAALGAGFGVGLVFRKGGGAH